MHRSDTDHAPALRADLLPTAGRGGAAGTDGSLEVAIVAGETTPHELINTHLERFPHAGLFTEYGATSPPSTPPSIGTSRAGLRGRVPVGRPVENNEIYVLDAGMRPVPIGVKGEIIWAASGLLKATTGARS